VNDSKLSATAISDVMYFTDLYKKQYQHSQEVWYKHEKAQLSLKTARCLRNVLRFLCHSGSCILPCLL